MSLVAYGSDSDSDSDTGSNVSSNHSVVVGKQTAGPVATAKGLAGLVSHGDDHESDDSDNETTDNEGNNNKLTRPKPADTISARPTPVSSSNSSIGSASHGTRSPSITGSPLGRTLSSLSATGSGGSSESLQKIATTRLAELQQLQPEQQDQQQQQQRRRDREFSSTPLRPDHSAAADVANTPTYQSPIATTTASISHQGQKQAVGSEESLSRNDTSNEAAEFFARDQSDQFMSDHGGDRTAIMIQEQQQKKKSIRESRRELMRQLLKPHPIPGLVNFGIPGEPMSEVDPEVQAKIEHFHNIKETRGIHFNQTLMKNKNFRNPHIYSTLVTFAALNETASNFDPTIHGPLFDFGAYGRESTAEGLAEEQKQIAEKLAQQQHANRTQLQFVGASNPPTSVVGSGVASIGHGSSSSTTLGAVTHALPPRPAIVATASVPGTGASASVSAIAAAVAAATAAAASAASGASAQIPSGTMPVTGATSSATTTTTSSSMSTTSAKRARRSKWDLDSAAATASTTTTASTNSSGITATHESHHELTQEEYRKRLRLQQHH